MVARTLALILAVGGFEMIMVHAVPPPWCRHALDVLNPLAWLGGSSLFRAVQRTLHVQIDEGER